MYLALARRFAEPGDGDAGRAHSLEALFAEARRSEDEADELLVAGGWEQEPDVPREPIPFVVRPAPIELGPADELPLFAVGSTATPPLGAAPEGEVVTLEELGQLLRRRKRRPKPVPEGQLALFG